MYVNGTTGYYTSCGEQHSRRAPFLILMTHKAGATEEVRGIIRKVALAQIGHWMMGKASIGKEWYILSGAYGHDGLTLDVEDDAFELGTPLPPMLFHWWRKGGGWNSCGSEAPMMREWGRYLIKQQGTKP